MIRNSQYLMHAEENDKFASCSFIDQHAALQYLLDEHILLMVDWKGEEQEFMIGQFFQQRILVLTTENKLNIEAPYAKLSTEQSKSNFLPGDAIPFLLKEFQKQLKPVGLAIVLLDLGNDSYYIGLSHQGDLKKITSNKPGTWPYVAFGSKTGEVLYTVNCSCGSMNVWQLKRGELLTDDYCQDCGKELFDKAGKASMPVIKDYI